MKLTVESKQVTDIMEFRNPVTKLRRIGLVYLQKGPEADRCMIRVISDATNGKWLESEIKKNNIYLPIDPIRVA